MTAIVRDHRTARPEVRDHRTESTSRPVVRDHRTESTNRGTYEWKGDHWERTRASSHTHVSVRPGTTRPPVLSTPPVHIGGGVSYPTAPVYQPRPSVVSSTQAMTSSFGSSQTIGGLAQSIADKNGYTKAGAEASMPPEIREQYEQLKKTNPGAADQMLLQQMMQNLKLITQMMSDISKLFADMQQGVARNLK